MTAADLLRIFELRRRGHADFWIAHVLNLRPSQLVPIGDAGNYEILMPREDWKSLLKALDESTQYA